MEEIRVLVEGGNAKPTPPLGPKLSQYRLPIGKVIQEINNLTKEFKGMQIPVKILVDTETREYKIEVGTPPTSQLIKKYTNWKEVRKNKRGKIIAARAPWNEEVGDISFENIVKIAKMKIKDMNTTDLKSAVKNVLGTCLSMGITVNGKNPKEVIKEVEEGKYDKFFSNN